MANVGFRSRVRRPVPPASDRQLLTALRGEIDDIFDQAIGKPRRVAVLQFPYDGNVGNHMMWLATTRYLRSCGTRVAYAAHTKNFDPDELARAIGDEPILFLGGVSISRLWPDHAETKRIVARKFPGNRLVSLASSMLFTDPEDESFASDVFAGHPDVTLLARDPISAAHATRVFGDSVKVLVQHDSALSLDFGHHRLGSPTTDVLWLYRDDSESAGVILPAGVQTFDWPDLGDPALRVAYSYLRVAGVFSRLRSAASLANVAVVNRAMATSLERASRSVVSFGAKRLATGRVLVTDRMHPHTLSVLIGQPVVLLPDRFGKNRAVFEYSTARFRQVHWADTPDEALELASALAATS